MEKDQQILKGQINQNLVIMVNYSMSSQTKMLTSVTRFILASLLISCSSLSAQTSGAQSSKLRRWTFSVTMGFASKGPASAIEKLLIDGGFNENDANPISRLPGQDHPYSTTGLNFQDGAPWMISTYYLVKKPISLGFVYSNTKIGTTWGFRQPVSFGINYSITTVAPVLALQFSDVIRLGAGPAFFHPKTKAIGFGTSDNGQIAGKSGLLLDLSLILPSRSNLFGELKIQYRRVGNVPVGPFEASSLGFDETLPMTEVNFSHWFIGIGFGVGT